MSATISKDDGNDGDLLPNLVLVEAFGKVSNAMYDDHQGFHPSKF